jgi:hypothetical protein
MNETDDRDALARRLFRAARQEQPSDATRERLIALLRSELRVASSADAGAADEHVEPRSTAHRTRFGYAAALAASVLGATLFFVSRARRDVVVSILPVSSSKREHGVTVPPPRAAISVPSAAPVASEIVPPESTPPRTTPHRAPRPVMEAPPPAPSVEPRRTPASLTEEIASLDRARSALARSDTSDALRALDDYDAVLHGTRLREEATLLRIEVLQRSGRSNEAAAMARKFIDANPGSSLTERARRFLEKGSGSLVGSRVDAGG